MHTLILRKIFSKGKYHCEGIHLLIQKFKNDFYEVDILRHHPVVPWLEDYIEEIEEIMGKDPWIIHGIAENSPALKKISSSLMLKGCSKKPRLTSCLSISKVNRVPVKRAERHENWR